jgi:hypothetical protein
MTICPIYNKVESDKIVKQMIIKLENDDFFKRMIDDKIVGGFGILSIISQLLIVTNEISKIPQIRINEKSLLTGNSPINFIEKIKNNQLVQKKYENENIKLIPDIYRVLNYDIYKKRIDCIPIFDNSKYKWLKRLLQELPWIIFLIIAYFVGKKDFNLKMNAHIILKALVEFTENVTNEQDYNDEIETFISFAHKNKVLMLTNGTSQNISNNVLMLTNGIPSSKSLPNYTLIKSLPNYTSRKKLPNYSSRKSLPNYKSRKSLSRPYNNRSIIYKSNKKINNDEYFFGENPLHDPNLKKINNDEYFFGENPLHDPNLKKINNDEYFFGENPLPNQKINNDEYFLGENPLPKSNSRWTRLNDGVGYGSYGKNKIGGKKNRRKSFYRKRRLY